MLVLTFEKAKRAPMLKDGLLCLFYFIHQLVYFNQVKKKNFSSNKILKLSFFITWNFDLIFIYFYIAIQIHFYIYLISKFFIFKSKYFKLLFGSFLNKK